jgi:hypothetical protein
MTEEEMQTRMRAAGLGALVTAIVASGALHNHGDDDLLERAKRAAAEHEAWLTRSREPRAA